MSLVYQPSVAKTAKYHKKQALSLSSYFPAGTHYFYGYPAGEDSGFLNHVPPVIEELVAARAVACAGDEVSVISFAATQAPQVDDLVLKAFGVPKLDSKQHVVLPAQIDRQVNGAERNRQLKQCLCAVSEGGKLVMAQPFTDEEMVDFYQIPAKLTTWLNDKNSLPQFIHRRYLPTRLATYQNGAELVANINQLSLPFVIKATNSSAGDGVFICQSKSDLQSAVAALKQLSSKILVEVFVRAKHNFGVHFGVPQRRDRQIDIIGINEQLTTLEGEFIGGLIQGSVPPIRLRPILKYVREIVLPYIREKGWYGVGDFDILEDIGGNFCIIDSNFRMTGMTAYHFLRLNEVLDPPLLGFGGSFKGSQEELLQQILPHGNPESPSRIMQIIALNRDGETWNFNAALLFEDDAQLWRRIRRLLIAGVRSAALEQMLGRLG